MASLTIAINAGGMSRRMGQDKAFLPVGGVPMIWRVIHATAALDATDTIIVTRNSARFAGFTAFVVEDIWPVGGVLGGIHTALTAAPSDYVLMLPVDMPFVSPSLLGYMVGLLDGDDLPHVIVPRTADGLQPMHALYSVRIADAIEERLRKGKLKVIDAYAELNVRYLDADELRPYDPHGHAFFNVNTPDDLTEAERIAGAVTR
jgi:molybdopterin-guanine dinucleotide biosynthesis protein A